MRVLLLGGTGNLGRRCIPALLAHKHTLVVYVRNAEKLKSLMSREIIERIEAIVVGDATDAEGIQRALEDHDIEGIVDVAGNQVLPWREYVLSKIAAAATEAAVEVGRRRGEPLRAWVTTSVASLLIPGTQDTLDSTALDIIGAQHGATTSVVSAIPTTDLKWSLLCVAGMYPTNADQGVFDLLQTPVAHNLFLQGETAPGWQHSWLEKIPWIGMFLHIFVLQIWKYLTKYEKVADVLAEDLEIGSDLWVGRRMGYIEKEKLKDL